ncbi:hypothetical protein MMC28_010399 [Mycoblastus sanguinarius]|nr:hypothetical protein [Mycoblastus sanguinarius]
MSISSVFTPPVLVPPEKRTFNADGTRISEVGLKEWPEGVYADTTNKSNKCDNKKITGQSKESSRGLDDGTSLKSGLSGDTSKDDSTERGGGVKKSSLWRTLLSGKRRDKKGRRGSKDDAADFK